jgi:hypothetical protein
VTRVSTIRLLSPGWWMRDHNGEMVLARWPNPALVVWLVTVLVGWTGMLGSVRGATVAGVGRGALVVWSLDELVRGESPFRRLLGALVLALQLIRIFG